MRNSNSNQLLQKDYRLTDGNSDSRSDEFLISKIVEGRINLFETITKRYNQRLYRIIRGYLSDENDVKDVMQTTYLKAFENLSQFRGEAKFSTWLIRIAINEALKKVQYDKNSSEPDSVTCGLNSDQIVRTDSNTPEMDAIRKDMNKHLEKAIDALPPKYRSVLIMREIEQMSTRETAESLNISRTNVKVRLHRAKKLLRFELEQMLDEIELFTFRGANCEQMTNHVMEKLKAKSKNLDARS